MAANSDELLKELFWRSSLRVAVLDIKGHVILTSKAFRDAFPEVVIVSEDMLEVLDFDTFDGEKTFESHLSTLAPGDRFSFSTQVPFAGVESVFRVEISALYSRKEDNPLFLTEWIPAEDNETVSRALAEIEQKYRNLQENLPVGIYRSVESGMIQTANSALIRMMGFDSFEELQNAKLAEVWVDPEQRERMIQRLRKEGSVLNYQVKLRRKNGKELIASFDARGTFDANGNLIYFDTIVQDITDRIKAKKKLERLARTDSLTDLYNRQYLMERLENEMSRTRRYKRPLSLIMLDLDHFKEVNDRYGHLAGDAVLASTASIVSSTLRETDFAGRYGGEEFVIVMPETDIQGASEYAERLRRTMEGRKHEIPQGEKISVTFSAGVAEMSGGDTEELIALADEALYRAKSSGRNRVEIERAGYSKKK